MLNEETRNPSVALGVGKGATGAKLMKALLELGLAAPEVILWKSVLERKPDA
jgi:hypothetical protein